jgi:eukaryotic translation initiation factor 2C
MIVVPKDGGGSSVLNQQDTLERTWEGFTKAAQTTYATATFQLVGHTFRSDFAQDPSTAHTIMSKGASSGANFFVLYQENKSTSAYSLFKDLADRRYGVQSLCIVHKGPKGFSPQYWGNITLKVNLKAGGINHTVDGIAEIMKDTLVIGADVTHAGQGSLLGTPSIAAVVGSVNQNGGKFLGSMRLQTHVIACEDIRALESMVIERIKA